MRILVLFAHPRLRQSVVQRALLAAIKGLDDITIRDLYADYPDLMIDSDCPEAAAPATTESRAGARSARRFRRASGG